MIKSKHNDLIINIKKGNKRRLKYSKLKSKGPKVIGSKWKYPATAPRKSKKPGSNIF